MVACATILISWAFFVLQSDCQDLAVVVSFWRWHLEYHHKGLAKMWRFSVMTLSGCVRSSQLEESTVPLYGVGFQLNCKALYFKRQSQAVAEWMLCAAASCLHNGYYSALLQSPLKSSANNGQDFRGLGISLYSAWQQYNCVTALKIAATFTLVAQSNPDLYFQHNGLSSDGLKTLKIT